MSKRLKAVTDVNGDVALVDPGCVVSIYHSTRHTEQKGYPCSVIEFERENAGLNLKGTPEEIARGREGPP